MTGCKPFWAGIFLALAGAPPLPALVFEETEIAYTAQPEDDEFTVEFLFRNDSSKPVRIRQVDSNCGCLRADADREVYEAGEEGKITAVFAIGSFEGVQTKSVQVSTDEATATADNPQGGREYGLNVKLTVPALIEIEPKLAVWELGGHAESRVFKVRMLHEDPVRITEVKSTRPNFKTEWKAVREGREYEITLTPDSVDKALLGMLTIFTDCPVTKHQRKMVFFSVQKHPVDEE